MVSDSATDRRWAKTKFGDDLKRALEEAPGLQGFVFLTHVELSVAERDSLALKARKAGIEFVDVLHRERLRILLDGPDGLAARFQFLRIPLSEAEQATFFARWGTQIQQLVTQRFENVERKLYRLEFLQECNSPVRSIWVLLSLKRRFTTDELGHFRVLVSVVDLHGNSRLIATDLVVRDKISEDSRSLVSASANSTWILPVRFGDGGTEAEESERKIRISEGWTTMREGVEHLSAGTSISGWTRLEYPIPTLGQLDGTMVFVAATAPLAQQIASWRLTANGYVLASGTADELELVPDTADKAVEAWPEPLSDSELTVLWVRLFSTGHTHWSVDFSDTPRRVWTPDAT